MNTPKSHQRVTRPAGPHILAQWLSLYGFSVKVIDFCSCMTTDDLVSITKLHISSSTVAIGVSSTFWDDNARYAGTKDPQKLAVVMRPGIGDPPEWVMAARPLIESSFPRLDWLLGGANSEAVVTQNWLKFHLHPEDQLRKYLDEKLSLNKKYHPFNILTSSTPYMDGLGIQPEEVLGLEWGRGCQFRCSFCRHKLIGRPKNTYLKDPFLIRQEMLLNYERYGTTRYIYVDDTTNETPEKVSEMAKLAQSLPFQLEWVGYGRLDLIGSNKSTIKALSDSGLRSMFFGIETFNKDASKIIGKGWNGIHGRDFLLELKQHWGDEINFHTNFIVGLNPETSEELDDTLQWVIQNKISSWEFIGLHISSIPTFTPSVFEKNCSKYGYEFPNPNKPNYWINGKWNFTSATEKAKTLTLNSRHLTYPAAFFLASVASLTGESLKETLKKKPIMTDLFAMSEKKINDYVKYQLSL